MFQKLATLLRELSWSKHLLLSQCKSEEEKEFYLLTAIRGHWSHRKLDRQIRKSVFERTMPSEVKLAKAGSSEQSAVNPDSGCNLPPTTSSPDMNNREENHLLQSSSGSRHKR